MMRKLAWFPIALLLMTAGYCFRWALADVWATQISYQLRQPSLTDGEWLLAGQMLQRALRLAPDQAASLDLAGQFYQAQAYRQASLQDLASRRDSQQKALLYFRQAVGLNPAWPYLWNRLALAKMGLQQYDLELSGALDRVAQLGPWEKALQFDTAVIGLAVTDQLTPLVGRDALYHAMEQSLKMQGKDELQSLLAQFKLRNLCLEFAKLKNVDLPVLTQSCAGKPE
jgi:tetratricopeptide (TPR) repeat protein